jgi:hypothetical protein
VVLSAPGCAPKPLNSDSGLIEGAYATIGRITVSQRRWREFRIAQSSCERDAATLPKIWTLSRAAIS